MSPRSVVAAVLLVVGAVLLPVGVLGFWAQRTLVDTDTYVATVSPLSDDPTVQQSVADQVTQTLVDAAADNAVVAQLLGTSAGEALRAQVQALVLRLVQSDRFGSVWDDLNRRVQVSATAALTGNPTGPVRVEGDRLLVDTNVALLAAQDELAQTLPVIGQLDLSSSGRRIVVADSPAVGQAQTYYGWLTHLGPWLLPAAAAALLLGVLLARRTARALVVVGAVCLVAAGVVALAIVGGAHLADQALTGTAFAPAAHQVVAILTTGVRTYAWWLVIAGVVLAGLGGLLAAARRGTAPA